jgi:hypothetical protein
MVKAIPRTPRNMSMTVRRPDCLEVGKSTCVMSPVTTALEPKPMRVVQRPAAHESQRRHFDHIALDQFGHALESHHFVERVVHGTQVGIDLLRQIAGKKTQALAGLHRRAYQHDAPDFFRLQRLNRTRHG